MSAVAEVVRAPDGSPCDFPYCRLAASWSVSLAIDVAPVYRCVMHWPFYRDKLRRDGYEIRVAEHAEHTGQRGDGSPDPPR